MQDPISSFRNCKYWCGNQNRHVENSHMKLMQRISRALHYIYQHFISKATSSTIKHSSSKGRRSMAEYILNDVSAATLHSPDSILGIWCTAWKSSRKSERVLILKSQIWHLREVLFILLVNLTWLSCSDELNISVFSKSFSSKIERWCMCSKCFTQAIVQETSLAFWEAKFIWIKCNFNHQKGQATWSI